MTLPHSNLLPYIFPLSNTYDGTFECSVVGFPGDDEKLNGFCVGMEGSVKVCVRTRLETINIRQVALCSHSEYNKKQF